MLHAVRVRSAQSAHVNDFSISQNLKILPFRNAFGCCFEHAESEEIRTSFAWMLCHFPVSYSAPMIPRPLVNLQRRENVTGALSVDGIERLHRRIFEVHRHPLARSCACALASSVTAQ